MADKSAAALVRVTDPEAITRQLEDAGRDFNLVATATSVATIPEGCSVSFAMMVVDTDLRHGEVFDVGGKLALGKPALEKLANMLGVDWDAANTRRLDDSSNPHYCYFQAAGRVRNFDGTVVTRMATKEMDLREGSAQVQALFARYEAALDKYRKDPSRGREPKEPSGQIREMRLHIVAHAESKARLRVVRQFCKASYEPAELKKPFMVARLMWTGETADPELRREFALMQAKAFLGAASELNPKPYAPPPPPPKVWTTQGETVRETPAPVRPPEQPKQTVDDDDHENAEPAGDVPVVPFGKSKGKPISELSDKELEWWLNTMAQNCEDPTKARFVAENERMLALFEGEMERRARG